MSDTFYTNVSIQGNKILMRGHVDGKPIQQKIDFSPTLYLPSNKPTEYKTLDGEYVESIKPGSINDCREFINKYKDVTGFRIFGNTDYIYQFIGKVSPGEIDYDFSEIKVANFDIETTCENGFPDIDDPEEKIIAITLDVNGWKYVFGLGEFKLEQERLKYWEFDNEEDLLRCFLDTWVLESPDIMTGWNIRFFDIPYLVNRMRRVLGEKETKRLSPWKIIKEKTITKMNREHSVYDLVGIATLDYYELYKTFTYVNQESYRLDHIAHVELGDTKLSYDEFDSMAEFYKKDFQKFMEYNVKDVELVQRLEDKLKLLELSVALAYSAKVNFMDVFSQVRTWDCIIYHYLNEHNIVIPQKKISTKDSQYAGAYVKDPITGIHDWIISLDLNSLYPHLIMQYNISPETKTDFGKDHTITPDTILKGTYPTETQYSLAANGTRYTKDYQGFLPALMEKMYKERKMYKKKMIECQKRQQAGDSGLENQISKFNNFQMVRKIQLNSAYGAIGNQYFRYFDVEMAEAITLSGQLSIRWIADKLNEFLNDTVGTKDYDYVVASDTDSVYLRLGNLVDKVCNGKSKSEVVGFLDKSAEEIILPFIKDKYDELASIMNAYDNKMVMDRECIADKGVWTAKKRYMMNVHDSEGIRYEEPKMKIMGIETTRSSTPNIVRQELKKAIKLVLTSDEESIIDFIEKFKVKFHECDPEEIAFPRGVNGLDRYYDSSNIYKKSTPIAVKGALIYNHYLKTHSLDRKYHTINEGEKIKFIYLKTPNPLGGAYGTDHVVSFPNSIPKEFGLEDYIDYEKQFNTSFLDPLRTILDTVGWKHETTSTLEGFFT
tara:strand:+ start:923 stop:3418 length:2496 start_codon:yes stop_codon:yes gene_type:complete